MASFARGPLHLAVLPVVDERLELLVHPLATHRAILDGNRHGAVSSAIAKRFQTTGGGTCSCDRAAARSFTRLLYGISYVLKYYRADVRETKNVT